MAKKQPTPQFDYSQHGDNVVRALRGAEGALQECDRKNTETTLAVGRRLADAKSEIDEGQFHGWLKLVGLEVRTAQNMMRAAAFVGERESDFASVPITVIYQLSQDDVPAALRDEIVAEFNINSNSGKRLSTREVGRRIAVARDASRSKPEPGPKASEAEKQGRKVRRICSAFAKLRDLVEKAPLDTLNPAQCEEIAKLATAVIERLGAANG